MPASARSVVVFPAPFGPTSPRISSGATEKESWSTATSESYVFVRLMTSSAGGTGEAYELQSCRGAKVSRSATPTPRSYATVQLCNSATRQLALLVNG